MNQFKEEPFQTAVPTSTAGRRPFHDDESPPPYPGPSSAPDADFVGYGNANEKSGLPQGMSIDRPSLYPSPQQPQTVTHVFVDRNQADSDSACCGCMSLRAAVICITVIKSGLTIISLVLVGLLLSDERWDDILSSGDEEVHFRHGLIIVIVVFDCILLAANLTGAFGAIKRHEISVLICVTVNILMYVIVIVMANMVNSEQTVSIGNVLGIALEIYMYYILIKYYRVLRASRRAQPSAQELVNFT